MKNIPDKIYLQIGEETQNDEDLAKIRKQGDVTWCEDQINSNDIEYIRTPDWENMLPHLHEVGEVAKRNGGDNRYRTAFIQGAKYIQSLVIKEKAKTT